MRYQHNNFILLVFLALSLVFAGLALSASQKPPTATELALYRGTDRQKILEEGARKEGKLTIYTIATEQIYRPIMKAFQKKYPYIKVDLWRGGSDTIMPRVFEEYKAKNYVVDVMRLTQGSEIVLREGGILQPFYSPETAHMEEAVVNRTSDGKGAFSVGNCESVQGLGYNTNLVKKEEVPKITHDLLDIQWKGKMAISGDSQSSNWVGSLLVAYGEKFVKQMAQQGIVVHMVSARALCDIVSNGEYALSPTITDAHVIQNKRKGAPIDWVPLEPVFVTLGQMTLPVHSSHPHAAMLYIDFELSKEAGIIYNQVGYDSPRKDIPNVKKYKKFYGAKSTKDVQEWHELFGRLFLKK